MKRAIAAATLAAAVLLATPADAGTVAVGEGGLPRYSLHAGTPTAFTYRRPYRRIARPRRVR